MVKKKHLFWTLLMCVVLSMSLHAELALFDNFDNGGGSDPNPGSVDGRAGNGVLGGLWDTSAAGTTFTAKQAGLLKTAYGSVVMETKSSSGGDTGNCFYGLSDEIEDTETGVLFFRFMVTNNKTTPVGLWVGLHDEPEASNPMANAATGQVDLGFRAINDVSGSGDPANEPYNITLLQDTNVVLKSGLARNQWYNVWIVADNTTDTFDLYISEASGPAGDATLPGSSDLVGDDLPFKNAITNSLRGFMSIQDNVSGQPPFAYFDEFWWDGSSGLAAKGAHTPTPANGDDQVDSTVVDELTWMAPLTKYDVDGDPNLESVDQYDLTIYPKLTDDVTADDPNFLTNGVTYTDVTSPYAITLDYDTTYFWRVDTTITWDSNEFSETGLTTEIVTGSKWQFSTLSSAPVFIQQPVDVRAFETDLSAVFTCQFSSDTAPTVLWYQVGNPTPLSAGGDIVISTVNDGGKDYTATLEFLTPELADEGEYYCTINNGTLVQSDDAYLIINRLMAQYDFDGSLAPAAGSLADAPTGVAKTIDRFAAEPNELLATAITAAFDTGVDGVGMAIVLDANDFVDFSTTGYPKAGSITGGIGRGMDAGTVMYWVKPTDNGAPLANYNEGGVTGFALTLSSGEARMNVRSESGQIGTLLGSPDRPGWDVFDGEWHLIAYTWETGVSAAVYVDGQPVASGDGGSSTVFADWQRSVLMGAGRQSSNRDFLNSFYGGAIDNLRIYNYPLDIAGNDVFAQEYYDNTGIVPCLSSTFEGDTFNFDNTGSSYCIVNLADFAKIAEAWLASGLLEIP